METSSYLFTKARLGRNWTEALALQCLAFFGSPYHFDWQREREFAAHQPVDYEPSGYRLRFRIRNEENESLGLSAIFDNGGATADRYTIYLPQSHDGKNEKHLVCLCLSENPGHPQGVSMFGSGYLGLHNGEFIGFSDLPEEVRRHAAARLKLTATQAAA